MTRAARAGAAAEEAAAKHLGALGLEVLARNVRLGRLEIDLVAAEDDVVALVEVRTRGPGAWVRALDSIDAKKRAKLRMAGERLWRDRFAKAKQYSRLRYDAVTVELDESDNVLGIEYVKGFMV